MVTQTVNCLSTMRETWVRSLGWENSLEKEMATHSSTLALKIPWTEELDAGYCPWGSQRIGHFFPGFIHGTDRGMGISDKESSLLKSLKKERTGWSQGL